MYPIHNINFNLIEKRVLEFDKQLQEKFNITDDQYLDACYILSKLTKYGLYTKKETFTEDEKMIIQIAKKLKVSEYQGSEQLLNRVIEECKYNYKNFYQMEDIEEISMNELLWFNYIESEPTNGDGIIFEFFYPRDLFYCFGCCDLVYIKLSEIEGLNKRI